MCVYSLSESKLKAINLLGKKQPLSYLTSQKYKEFSFKENFEFSATKENF